jgi:hypothetical protein
VIAGLCFCARAADSAAAWSSTTNFELVSFAPRSRSGGTLLGNFRRFLDSLGWAAGLPARLLAWDHGVNSHDFSGASQEQLVVYLQENELTDVLVRVNQYDPKGEWRRLRENAHLNPGWKYTVGLWSLANYTVFPGRVFGGDEYNPYTNSLSLNSDVPAIALHEAAYAKDIRGERFPGTYAFVSDLPIVSLWRHTRGVNEVLAYAHHEDDWQLERETYRVVYPLMGAEAATAGGPFVPWLVVPLLQLGGAAAGHAAAHAMIVSRQPVEAEASPTAEPTREIIPASATEMTDDP